ncbi:MAG: outer membrane beta-barrel protein [Proteobacteria bacterium]|nr:outer membrane beta-barrel protein [Pseudomonadota bacterium]
MILPALLAVGVFTPVGARAQLLDTAYPADVPGFGTAAGVSVTSRIQSDVAWHEIPLGAELLHPEVTQAISYDSAILPGRQPSWMVETAPSLALRTTDGASAIGAVVSSDTTHYLAGSGQTDTDWTAAIGDTFDFADCAVTAAVAHLTLHETDTALDAAQYDQPLGYSVDTLRLSAETPSSRLTVRPSFDLSRFQFGTATIGGVAAPQSYRDRLVGTLGLTVSYGIEGYGDPNRLQLTLRGDASRYPNVTIGQPSRNSAGGTALVGVEHDLDGLWGWRIAVGVGGRLYHAPYPDQLVPLAEAAVAWQPNERTTWHAALVRRIEDAADEGIGGYVATIGGIAMDRELQRDLILHLGVDADHAAYGAASSQTFVSGQFGLQWLISSALRAKANVTLTDHRSTAAAPYGENLVLLSITAGL